MSIDTLERILAEHPFFEGMAEPHLDTLVGCAKNVSFEAGQFLFRAGQPADSFFLVRHGRVAVESVAPGPGSLVIETVSDGDVLGWSWLFPPYRWHFDARATAFVRAFSLDGKCLRGKCERDPAFGFALIQRFAGVVVQRLESTQMQLMDLYGDSRRR
jgi:CRP-like cAMP-binding protein